MSNRRDMTDMREHRNKYSRLMEWQKKDISQLSTVISLLSEDSILKEHGEMEQLRSTFALKGDFGPF
ncbi:hypothetical protein BDZ89DRAFT_1059443 [Hymenopellis radicata]|nr:hypothetical protein BDZ89DRAFT_1059443 [Hymenopellis radicata]